MSKEALEKRYNQGWVMKVTDSLDECISLIRQAKKQKEACSIGYRGNVVDLWYELNYTQSISEMRVIDVWNLKKINEMRCDILKKVVMYSNNNKQHRTIYENY